MPSSSSRARPDPDRHTAHAARVAHSAAGAPHRQRDHHTPARTGGSPTRYSPRHLAAMATRLTPRDRWLIAMLHEHRVFTTHALAHMAFTSDHRARRRLLQLYRWDILDRFAPRLPYGAAPWHHVLAPTGAAALAAEHGLPLRVLGYRRDTALAIAHHHALAHTIAVNDLFAHLIDHTQQPTRHLRPGQARTRLRLWWSEARCRRVLEHARPDAYAHTHHPTPDTTHTDTHGGRHGGRHGGGRGGRDSRRGRVLAWFLELDMGSSTLDVLAGKLDAYAHLAATDLATGTHPRPILFWFPTPAREAHAREHLHRARYHLGPHLLPIATSTAAIATLARNSPGQPGPADPVWLPLLDRPLARRGDLADLATLWPPHSGTDLSAFDATDNPGELGDAGNAIGTDDDGGAVAGLPAPPPIPPLQWFDPDAATPDHGR